MAATKQCHRCQRTLPVARFVDSSGSPNPRGHYCRACHLQRLGEWHRAALERERGYIRKLRIVYGDYWRHHATPDLFHTSLHDERDFCPYCGTPYREVTPNPFNETPSHLDHMDPLDRGGEHSIRNVVFCCGPCNLKKGKQSFVAWLAMLEPKYRRLARDIYRTKHGHPPEDFVESHSTSRAEFVLYKSEQELKELFPKPIVDGPPARRPVDARPNKRQRDD